MRRQKKTCPVTEAGIRFIDYKDERFLSRFITDTGKILPSRLSGVDARHQIRRIGIDHRFRIRLIDFVPRADRVFVGVIDTVFTDRAAFDTVDHRLFVGTDQVNHVLDIDDVFDHLHLVRIPRDAIENQKLIGRFVLRDRNVPLQRFLPNADGQLIGNELALRAVLVNLAAFRRSHVERTEDVATGEVIEPRNAAENRPLRPFAHTRSTEQQHRGITTVEHCEASIARECKRT